MDQFTDSDGIQLANPIDIKDVINSGSCFEIQSNFEDSFDGLELFDEAEDFDDETKDKFKNPWTQKFDELKLSMRMVSQYIYKRVEKAGIGERTVPKRASVRVDYNGYFENDDQPYDSTLLRGTPETHRVCNGAMSVGLSEAIMTMKVGEEAWFWISHELLFGELGCPPRIPPKADALIFIKLWKFEELGDDEDENFVMHNKYDKSYKVVAKKVDGVYLTAKTYVNLKNYAHAIFLYTKAVQALELSQLKDEAEQIEQQSYLIKLYTNLCVCYNKKEEPKKTCLMVKELRRLTNVNENAKILYAEGRALIMLCEFSHARKVLLQAQRLEPNSRELIIALQDLEQRASDAKRYELEAAKRAMQFISEAEEIQANEQKDAWEDLEEKRQAILKEITRFMESKETRLNLPDHFSSAELTLVEDIANSLQLKLNIAKYGEKTYYLSKN